MTTIIAVIPNLFRNLYSTLNGQMLKQVQHDNLYFNNKLLHI